MTCPSGTFCNVPGLTAPPVCPPGFACPSVSAAPTPCASPGFYALGAATTCSPCPASSVCSATSVTSANTCRAAAGSFCVGGAPRWSFAPWTNDADSNVNAAAGYLIADALGATNAVVLNGVTFRPSATSPSANYALGGKYEVKSDVAGNFPAGSGSLALSSPFIWGGAPRTITFSQLSVGVRYELVLYSFGWGGPGYRVQSFDGGGVSSVIDQNVYTTASSGFNGIRVALLFDAVASTAAVTIMPQYWDIVDWWCTFHTSGLTLRAVPAAACAAGTFSAVVGLSACTACPVGTRGFSL